MTYSQEVLAADGVIKKKKRKKHRKEERKYEKKFIEKMREEVRAEKIRDDGIQNPYDGFVAGRGRYMSYEAKFEDNVETHNNDTWRRIQPHQFDNLFFDYQCGHWPFKLVIWNPKYVWKEPEFKVLTMTFMLEPRVKLPEMPSIIDFPDLHEILEKEYEL